MAAFLVLSVMLSAALTLHLHSASGTDVVASAYAPATRAVVIVLDGVRPEDLSPASTPNLVTLEQNGVTYTSAWVGQMETVPSASAASIGTGSFPRHHGVIADEWYDSRSHGLVIPNLEEQVLVGSIDGVMEPTGVGSLARVMKARTDRARILSVGGTNCAAASAAATWVADYVVCAARRQGSWRPVSLVGHALPSQATAALRTSAPVGRGRGLGPRVEGWYLGQQDAWIAREAIAAMRATGPSLSYISFPEIALVAPHLIPSRRTAVLRSLLEQLDSEIGTIVRETKREGTYRRTLFVVTGARGRDLIRRGIERRRLITAAVAAGGQAEYVAGDSTAVIGLHDPLQAQPVAQAIQSSDIPAVDAVFYKTQTGEGWSYAAQYLKPGLPARFSDAVTYLLSTLAGTSSPDVVVVFAPGRGVVERDSTGVARQTAMQGVQWPEQHVPLIVAGNGVYAGRTSGFPARLVDIAPTVAALMGLPAPGKDGVVLRDAMYTSPPGSNTEPSAGRSLLPLLKGLRARASK